MPSPPFSSGGGGGPLPCWEQPQFAASPLSPRDIWGFRGSELVTLKRTSFGVKLGKILRARKCPRPGATRWDPDPSGPEALLDLAGRKYSSPLLSGQFACCPLSFAAQRFPQRGNGFREESKSLPAFLACALTPLPITQAPDTQPSQDLVNSSQSQPICPAPCCQGECVHPDGAAQGDQFPIQR